MRESEIEEGIMKGGVEECIEEKEPDICIRQETETSILLNIMILFQDIILLESEFTMRASGDGKDDDAGDEEADAGKKHLASGHVCCNLIFLHSGMHFVYRGSLAEVERTGHSLRCHHHGFHGFGASG